MFSIFGFQESMDPASVRQPIACCVDDSVQRNGDDLYVPDAMPKLFGAAAFVGATGLDARIVTPSLRNVGGHYIRPLTLGIIPAAITQDDVDNYKTKTLQGGEAMNFEINATTATEVKTGIVWMSDKEITEIYGEITTIKATFTITSVVGRWVYGDLTLSDDIASGSYSLVGARAVGANLIAVRFKHPNWVQRPGIIAAQTEAGNDYTNKWRNGKMGVWGTFTNRELPGVEILASAAAAHTAESVYLDIIKAS